MVSVVALPLLDQPGMAGLLSDAKVDAAFGVGFLGTMRARSAGYGGE